MLQALKQFRKAGRFAQRPTLRYSLICGSSHFEISKGNPTHDQSADGRAPRGLCLQQRGAGSVDSRLFENLYRAAK
jgi:hypothetical protein